MSAKLIGPKWAWPYSHGLQHVAFIRDVIKVLSVFNHGINLSENLVIVKPLQMNGTAAT